MESHIFKMSNNGEIVLDIKKMMLYDVNFQQRVFKENGLTVHFWQ